jgi:hypothetical protein
MTEIFNFLQQRAQRSIDRLREAPEFQDMFSQGESEERLYELLHHALSMHTEREDLPASNVCDAIIKVLVDYAGSEGVAGLSLLQRLGHQIHLHTLIHRLKDQPDTFADWFEAGVPPEWWPLELMQYFEPKGAGDSGRSDGDSGRGDRAGDSGRSDGGGNSGDFGRSDGDSNRNEGTGRTDGDQDQHGDAGR